MLPHSASSPPTLLCLGMGYTARRLGHRLQAEGWHVAGTARPSTGTAALTAEGFEALLFDRATPLSVETLNRFGHILVSVPPDEAGDPVLDTMSDALAQAETPRWIGYLSTTGVYGDTGGAWVDETSPTEPTQPRSIRRREAESAWLDLHRRHGRPVEVFRLAGIYGPGRSALDTVRAGRAHRVIKPGHVVCRIHVDDIGRMLRAAMATPSPGWVFNGADDEPAPPQDVIAEACALLGVTTPPEVALEDADLSPMARSFYADTRRVGNSRIKDRLGVTLRYPTYREGLRAILADSPGVAQAAARSATGR
ncbi:SDR family oxidoreductase [Roseospira marina]|uniref:SDR family oxidoreductase n=1 Tax=Roseospira marina TaxID=140057 RepID=A0A5M6IBG7_9PROT|nr:SDR family oxidoreductase [Roseospira marina]KAA5605640.1 SDR family oxidoreductase [Roseospira marina]MBB4313285.1 nucleoside-diphosphate-sugar epimerase [Roseospira marina]MBB5085974.1 nucleoside-diphosphate-sugar epimerase [Roseospira marina]